jgi:hypothetical protein
MRINETSEKVQKEKDRIFQLEKKLTEKNNYIKQLT